MRIQHNITALNAYRQLNTNNNAVAKNLEKLSSGYKINRAGDDAAGLAISEKMRSQIAGLEAAQKNANDGISLIQTAEGNLQEVHSMLNRMVELATMAANGTYEDTNRAQYQKEIDALNEEIDRIAASANFNGKKLLDGTLSTASKTYTVNSLSSVDGTDVEILPTAATPAVGTNTILHKDGGDATKTTFEIDLANIGYTNNGGTDSFQLSIGGNTIGTAVTFGATTSAEDMAQEIAEALDADGATSTNSVAIGNAKYDVTASGSKLIFTMNNASELTDQADFTGDFDVRVEFTADATQASAGTIVGGSTGFSAVNIGTENVKEGSVGAGGALANTAFTLTRNDVADGAALKIGDEVYVFAQTQETLDALKSNSTIKVVDLTQAVKDEENGIITDDNGFVNAAVDALTNAAAGNGMFGVGQSGTDGQVTLQEKASYSGDADLTTVDGIKEQIKKFAPETLITTKAAAEGTALTLQVGDTNDSYQKMSISIESTSAENLGVADVDVSTEASAGEAIAKINAAIDKVSDIRAGLGALQNRLDHTINNLGVTTENITAAESRIRDTDMAEEMMNFTKNNILVQSAQAMLAQANMLPQSVLQLLQ